MDAMSKEKEAEEKAAEEKAAEEKPVPNPATDKTKEIEKEAGQKMEDTIKEETTKVKDKLEADVKAQEKKAAVAKSKSKQADTKSVGPDGHSDDETWTANMPDSALKSFVQKKVEAKVKK